jgi:hypothetical protein
MMIEQIRGYSTQYTVDSIAQLTTAMASYHGMVAMLTTTNDKLASQMEAAQAYIKMFKDYILALKENIRSAWQGQLPAKSTNKNNYCWSHGHHVHKDHTSATCKTRKYGHQEIVTKDNTLEGVTWVKE